MSAASPKMPPVSNPLNPVYNLEETAQLLRVSVPSVRRFIKQGELRPTRLGKRVVVMYEDIIEFLRKKRGM